MYAIIPDLHGDYPRLERTLRGLGFRAEDGRYSHPEDVKAIFLGDFIDGGTQNARVIATVRQMQRDGHAHAIMGNHELNALLYHTPDPTRAGQWLRKRGAGNRRQHGSFLAEFCANADDDVTPVRDATLRDVLGWFQSLPVYLDFGAFRVIHAHWSDDDIALIRARRAVDFGGGISGAVLSVEDLPEIGACSTPFGLAVDRSLKGIEADLPAGVAFTDTHGKTRSSIRIKWWAQGEPSVRNLALSVPHDMALPEVDFTDPAAMRRYGAGNPPVFVGHYKQHGRPVYGGGEAALCLDYPRTPCAYRWRAGDTAIRADGVVVIAA